MKLSNHIDILQKEVRNLTTVTQRQQERLNQLEGTESHHQKRGRKASKSATKRRKSQISNIDDRSRSGFFRKCCVQKHIAIEQENND